MKVLLLCYRGSPFCGGLGIYIYYLSHELAKLGAEVDVVVGPPYPDPLDEWATVHKVENLNLWMVKTKKFGYEKLTRVLSFWNFVDYILTRFHIFPEMETFSMRAFFIVRRLLKKKRYDIIHDVNGLGWGLLCMKGFGIPVISTIHHPLTRDRDADLMMDKDFWGLVTSVLFYPLMMQRFVIKRLDRVITSSREGIDELNRAFGVRKDKISVVYNGMDVEGFRNTGEKREEKLILFVGNTEDHKKGILFLLEALKNLPEDIRLTIVDEGPPLKKNAFQIVQKIGVQSRVKFTGKVDQKTLVSLYSRATVLVMSSLYEGFGLPAAEAMACETPVVVTKAGALPEVVDDSCGILVEPGDSRALSDAIMEIMKNKKARSRMGANGRKRAVDNFSWPVAAANTLDVYRDVINIYRRKQ
ncbi:MAG TPA: glycosyltransferase family 4 protein [Spirochaetota bacterium]|nr:glycosyltransferase family 4 protein [Spirochaetota bacterium]HPG49075.1 glycosyltransferase family 4 protein [Spirochaetota bacterium]HPN11485.1 glycosyltransferase family 4 protein [Spirochaetota bacterium]